MEKLKKVCDRCNTDNTSNANYCAGCGYRLPEIAVEQKEEVPVKTTKSNLQKQIFSVVGMVVGFLIIWGIQKFAFAAPGIDKAMVQWASEINKNCPMMLDEETRLDNTLALPDKVFQYNYTLVNWGKEDIDTLEFKKIMEPQILNITKTNPQLEIIRKNEASLNYYYKDRDGKYVCTISVTPDLYK